MTQPFAPRERLQGVSMKTVKKIHAAHLYLDSSRAIFYYFKNVKSCEEE